MDWPILDFLFNLLVASGLIALLIFVWAIIISAVAMLFEE